jgi:hypothetical protein
LQLVAWSSAGERQVRTKGEKQVKGVQVMAVGGEEGESVQVKKLEGGKRGDTALVGLGVVCGGQ